LAQVSGSFCKTLTNKTREEALQEAKFKATEAAYEAGALRESIRIVDVVDVPLSYLPGDLIIKYYFRLFLNDVTNNRSFPFTMTLTFTPYMLRSWHHLWTA
jgi:hypothetical protein